jgi:hypothetical protein
LFNKEFTDLWGITTALDLFLVLGTVDMCFQIIISFVLLQTWKICILYILIHFHFCQLWSKEILFQVRCWICTFFLEYSQSKIQKCILIIVHSENTNTGLSKTTRAQNCPSIYKTKLAISGAGTVISWLLSLC